MAAPGPAMNPMFAAFRIIPTAIIASVPRSNAVRPEPSMSRRNRMPAIVRPDPPNIARWINRQCEDAAITCICPAASGGNVG